MSSTKIALLSDIHGNSPALQVVLDDIQFENCAEVFMLGDMINGMDPSGCVQMLLRWSETNNVKLSCIKGNAEAYLSTPDLDSLPRQDEEWNRDMMTLIKWYESHLSESDLRWIRSFPDTVRWHNAYLVHDSPLDRLEAQTQSDDNIPPQYKGVVLSWPWHYTPDTRVNLAKTV